MTLRVMHSCSKIQLIVRYWSNDISDQPPVKGGGVAVDNATVTFSNPAPNMRYPLPFISTVDYACSLNI